MATNVIDQTAAATLERHIEEHRKRAEELRRELGDPSTGLGSFLRDRFKPDALARARREHQLSRSSWLDADDPDDDGW